ncbi:MAG: competence protein ComFB [Spirochaetaceae bacterium]|nr:MAG: competence protein ComFB [Spirochaetaceae bacterium]
MEIHNVMEKEVLRIINEMCDDEEREPVHKYCTSRVCRMDAACYVLNRIPPTYVTSSRGVARVEQDCHNNVQLEVDIMRLASEALRRITDIQRSYYTEDTKRPASGYGPHFNFPTINGRLFNGLTFEPIKKVHVSLLIDNEIAPMMDSRWQNPYFIDSNTAGTYTFWPCPVGANEIGAERSFELELQVLAEGFEPFHHFFTLALKAESEKNTAMRYAEDYEIKDSYLLST